MIPCLKSHADLQAAYEKFRQCVALEDLKQGAGLIGQKIIAKHGIDCEGIKEAARLMPSCYVIKCLERHCGYKSENISKAHDSSG